MSKFIITRKKATDISVLGYDYVNGKLVVNKYEANLVRKIHKLALMRFEIDNMSISTKYNKKWRLNNESRNLCKKRKKNRR